VKVAYEMQKTVHTKTILSIYQREQDTQFVMIPLPVSEVYLLDTSAMKNMLKDL
jgi:hypothetical protein